jgi:hypothetical protein
MRTLDEHQALYDKVQVRRAKLEAERLKPPLIRLWDGDYRYRGAVAGERSGNFEFIENDTGTANIQLPLEHHLAKWVMDYKGRSKRNVHITIDKQGMRWSGLMDTYTVKRDKSGDAWLDVTFQHDFEQAKHILCWANPFLRPDIAQFPKAWVIFGPAKFCLLLTLFVNLFRLESSLWTIPDNPLDPLEWMWGPSFFPRFWRNVVKPFPLLADNSNITIIFSRFKTWFDVAKPVLEDAQLTVECRRYLHGEDEHPFKDLTGELDISMIEELFARMPLRHGCLVWDIKDNSGWGTETAFGGSLLTGLIRAVVNIASDGFTEGVDVFTGDPEYPGEYYVPGFMGTNPRAPWVVYVDGPLTGITDSEFQYFEATDTSFITGGKSMPGINEAISAGINIGGDFLTSFINTAIAGAAAASPIGVPPIDIPGLGGMMDAAAKPLYENTFAAFNEVPTLRAASLDFPGLDLFNSSLGDFHMFEGWASGADRAFTLSAAMAIRAKMWETRQHSVHNIKISDAAPFMVGEHFGLGSRIGATVRGYPVEDTIFVERVHKIKFGWDKDGPKGWELEVGHRKPQDPVLRAMDLIRTINTEISQLGIW